MRGAPGTEAKAGSVSGAEANQEAPASAAEVLRRAADLIEPEGCWAQGEWFDDHVQPRCFCAEGALAHIQREWLPEMVEFSPAGEALKAYLKAQGLARSIVDFNDSAFRTQAEVVAALRAAAAVADGASSPSPGDGPAPGMNEQ